MSDIPITELITTHAEAIATLQQECKEYSGADIGVPFDGLFVLRYVLSAKGDLAMASSKLRETLKWRTSNLEKLNLAAQGVVPNRAESSKHFKSGIVGWLGNDLLFCSRAGLGDMVSATSVISEEDYVDLILLASEVHFRMVDQRTREVGVLCKVITLVDMYDFTMSRFTYKILPVFSKSSAQSNVYFPQLLRHTVFTNLPTFVWMVVNTLKPVLPKDTVDKQRICPGDPRKQSASECPFLRAKAAAGAGDPVKILPKFLGGTAPTPDHLKHDLD